jgi:hypothetical protein
MPFTLRNLSEDLADVGSNFDGAPDLEFRLASKALAPGAGIAATTLAQMTERGAPDPHEPRVYCMPPHPSRRLKERRPASSRAATSESERSRRGKTPICRDFP